MKNVRAYFGEFGLPVKAAPAKRARASRKSGACVTYRPDENGELVLAGTEGARRRKKFDTGRELACDGQ